MTTPALAVAGLSVDYAGLAAVEDVTATFPAGSMTAVVGPNGAGKSTLIKAVLGLVPARRGAVRVFGQTIDQARARVAYMPQRAAVDWDFPVSAADVVAMGLYADLGPFGRMTARHRDRVAQALARTGLTDLARRPIGALSGGQQARVFLARALAQGADLYLLDEPFAAVDARTEEALVTVLKALRDEGAAVVAVHHDLAAVPRIFARVLMLNRRVVADGPVAAVFTPEAITRTYSQAPAAAPAVSAAALPLPA
ncbi:MAG TPA: metal ABC transporter ATP-binding protein [Paracoccaceae bacterium]|nr:metal ABC transporter ATP-binding protein [Paracoccaceae bacterium]